MSLEQMQQQLSFLNGGFYICVFLAIACLAVSLIMFWRFDILEVFRERTGIAAKRAAAAFNEANANTTGPLAADSGVLAVSGTLGTKKRLSGRLGNRKIASARGTSGPLSNEGSGHTAVLPSERAKADNPEAFTGVLELNPSVEMPSSVAELEASIEAAGNTALNQAQSIDSDFVITKEVLLIHTQESLDD